MQDGRGIGYIVKTGKAGYDQLINQNQNQETEEERLKRLGNYFTNLRQNAANLQATANYATKFAEDRKQLFGTIDNPSPQEVEQAHPIKSLLNYTPVNPMFMQNISNAVSSWFGGKPEHPVWNANYGEMFLDSKIQKLNEIQQYQNLAYNKERSPEQMDQLNQYVSTELKKGNYKNAKIILQAMPENYEKLSPNKKVETLSNSTETEKQYLSWKTKQAEKIKKGEEERQKKQNFATNASEAVQGDDWFSNMKRDALGTIGNIIKSTYEPIQQSVEKVNKAIETPDKNIGDTVKNVVNMVGGLLDLGFSVGMGVSGINPVIGASKGSMVENQFNLVNNAAMQIMTLPGTAAAEVSKYLGVDDPELLQSISTVANGATLMAVPAFKEKYTNALTNGVGKMIKENKLRVDNSLAEDARLAINAKEGVEIPNKEALPVGEQVIKDIVSQKNIAEGTPANKIELEQAHEIAKRKTEVFTSSESLSKPEEYAQMQNEWKASGKSKADFARDLMAKEDELAKQVEALPKTQAKSVEEPKPVEEVKPKEEEVAEDVGSLDEDMPPVPKQTETIPEPKKIEEPPPEDLSNPYDDYEPTPTEKQRIDAAKESLNFSIPLKDIKDEAVKEFGEPTMVKVSDISVHPKMQFKGNAGEGGVTQEGKISSKEYDPKKAGTYLLWKDKESGKTYVVDGHHRLDFAKEKGVESIPAYYSNAKTLSEARAEGALNNMANGKGSSVDVARFMKEYGFSLNDLQERGLVPKSGSAAKRGVELSNLNGDLLDKVEKSTVYDKNQETISSEMLPEKYGIVIGKEAPISIELSKKHVDRSMSDIEAKEYERLSNIQKSAFDYLKENPDTNPTVLTEIIKEKMGDKPNQKGVVQDNMFGGTVIGFEKERAELRADFEKQMSADLNLAMTAKNKKKASGLEEKGMGELNTEKGQAEFDRLARQRELWNGLKYNELSEITNKYAKELSEVKNATERKAIRERHNADIESAIQSFNKGAEGPSLPIGEKNAGKDLFGEAVSQIEQKPVRLPKDIKLEIKNTKEIEEGNRFFDKDGQFWEVSKTTPEGDIIARDGYDDMGNQKVQKFSGDIELRGLNSVETSYVGGLAMDEATQKSINILNELEGKPVQKLDPLDPKTAKIYKDNLEQFKKDPLFKRMLKSFVTAKQYAAQKFPMLDYNDARQAFASTWARTYEGLKNMAFSKADGALYFIQKPLKKVKGGLEAFSMRAYYKTLLNDYDNGLYTNKITGENYPLPDGLKIDFIRSEVAKLDKQFMENKYLKAADDIYKLHWDNILFDGVESGAIPKEFLKNKDSYFHKQVLEYFPREDILNGDLWRDQSNMNFKRHGSDASFSTNWFVSQGMTMNHIIRKTLEMKHFMEGIKKFDIRNELIQKAKELGKDKIDIPENYVRFEVDSKSTFKAVSNLAEDLMNHIIGEENTKLGGKEFIIHKNIAKLLNDAIYYDKDIINKAFRSLDKAWKVNTLFNPFRFAKYELRNAWSDNSAILGIYPGIFKKFKEAWIETANLDKNKVMSEDVNYAIEHSVFKSGVNSKEFMDIIKSVSDRDLTQMFNPVKPKSWNLPQKYLKKSVELNDFRENFTRLAAFKYFKERLLKNPDAKIYGASNRKVIDSITDPLEKAAQLARDLMVDYGNSTEMANRLGRGIAPFYRWIEGNPKRIINQLKNIPYEDGSILKNAGKFGIRGTSIIGVKLIKYAVLSQAAYGLVQLYNRTLFPEASKKLTASQARSGDMIIHVDDDGTVMTLPLESYFNDFLGWFGADDYLNDAIDLIAGRKSMKDVVKESYQATGNKLVQSIIPIPKILYEYGSGKSFYNINNPTPITDRKVYLARAAQAEPLYRMVKNMLGQRLPERDVNVMGVDLDKNLGLLYNTISGAIFNKTNLDELAYNIIRAKTFQYQQDVKGKEAPSSVKNDAGEALYYYKTALKYNDREAAKYYENKYKEIKKSEGASQQQINQGLRSTIQNYEPLHAVNKSDREDFKNNYLSYYEREILKTAEDYYRKTYVETVNK